VIEHYRYPLRPATNRLLGQKRVKNGVRTLQNFDFDNSNTSLPAEGARNLQISNLFGVLGNSSRIRIGQRISEAAGAKPKKRPGDGHGRRHLDASASLPPRGSSSGKSLSLEAPALKIANSD
jgi:hypothetical protein